MRACGFAHCCGACEPNEFPPAWPSCYNPTNFLGYTGTRCASNISSSCASERGKERERERERERWGETDCVCVCVRAPRKSVCTQNASSYSFASIRVLFQFVPTVNLHRALVSQPQKQNQPPHALKHFHWKYSKQFCKPTLHFAACECPLSRFSHVS